MKIVNKHKLPEVFIRAVLNDPYSKGQSDFSATSLETPPRALALIETFKDTLEIDASTKVASLIGQGTHKIAERAARPGLDVCEQRYFATFVVDTVVYTISAQIDLYEIDTARLYDWKTTKAFAFSKKAGSGKKPEWIAQMNIGAEIMRRNDIYPKSLAIIALLKDWNKREIVSPGYPQTEVMAVELPMWSRDEVSKYIEDKIRAHVKAKLILPLCSSKDTWGGNRCKGGWCDAAQVCSQYLESKRTGIIQED